MNLAGYQDVVAKDADTALKVNISWHFFFPGCSTTPWQLDGVIGAMKQDGYDPGLIHACHNRTVVIDARLGEFENKQVQVVESHGLRNVHLYEDGEEWISIRDAVGDLVDQFLCLRDVYPKGFRIPKRFIGENILHLPTVKTHVFTTMTGAMKNAFGGLLNTRRHYTHTWIHETLVDLLAIQKQIHKGIFCVMDGTIAGDGPGPRTMRPVEKDVILASDDQVAVDAVAAKLMGFDPMSIGFIRMAHERGLGVGRMEEIDIVGDVDAAKESWGFSVGDNLASHVGDLLWFSPLKVLQKLFFHTPLVNLFVFGSFFYHDYYWWPVKGKKRMDEFQRQKRWGQLFSRYPI